MCREFLKRKVIVSILVILIALGVTGPVFAVDYSFWIGTVSSDASDPNNWEPPILPAPGRAAMLGVTSDWTNVNHVPPYQPVISSVWEGDDGDPNGGWWLLRGVSNSLTISDGAFIKFTHNDCTLRNGSTLHVTGQAPDGGPSLIIPPRFHLGESGNDTANFPDVTDTILIDNNGYLRFDPSVALGGSGGSQIYIGDEVNGLIEIRDDGILELVSGTHREEADTVIPQFVFGSSDPNSNKVLINDNGLLILAGDPVTCLVGGQETSLEDIVDMGLIANGQGALLSVGGRNPTMISVAKPWATHPSPSDGESGVASQMTLSWGQSKNEVVYDVYFGSDVNSVTEATRDNPMDVLVVQDLEGTSFDIDVLLDYNQTYYWRVDAINDTDPNSPWASSVWSFTAGNFDIVEDFEDYNDYPPDEIWETWIDGYGVSENGSSAGYPNPDFVGGEHYVETGIIHGGKQSMPMFYENTDGVINSEVTRTFDTAQDWTRAGINTLTLYVFGQADNVDGQFYVKINGVEKAADVDLTAESWQEVSIDLVGFAADGVDLQLVTSLTISIQGAGSGMVFIDDIRVVASLE